MNPSEPPSEVKNNESASSDMPSNNVKTVETGHNLKKRIIIGVLILLLTLLSTVAGIPQFAYATVKCGDLPVSASRFAASYTYVQPGEAGYYPSPFNEYYCTSEAAERAGFRPGGWTERGQKEETARNKKVANERAYTPTKIPFTAYSPTYLPEGYAKDPADVDNIKGNLQVIQNVDLKKNHYYMARMRQGLTANGDEYETCTDIRFCKVVGKDAAGRPIYSDGNLNPSYSIKFDKSYFNLEPDERFYLSEADAVNILSSLVVMKSN